MCHRFLPVTHNDVNSRGINHLLQINGAHISDFRKLKYVHVTFGTFSGFLVATALTGEATKYIISHCLCCFSILDAPNQIKTDNGTGYQSQAFETSADTLISILIFLQFGCQGTRLSVYGTLQLGILMPR